MLGEQIVMIQNIIMIAPKEISNQNGQVCFVSEFAITLKNKVKFSWGCIVIFKKKSNIIFCIFLLVFQLKVFTMNHWWNNSDFYFLK